MSLDKDFFDGMTNAGEPTSCLTFWLGMGIQDTFAQFATCPLLYPLTECLRFFGRCIRAGHQYTANGHGGRTSLSWTAGLPGAIRGATFRAARVEPLKG